MNNNSTLLSFCKIDFNLPQHIFLLNFLLNSNISFQLKWLSSCQFWSTMIHPCLLLFFPIIFFNSFFFSALIHSLYKLINTLYFLNFLLFFNHHNLFRVRHKRAFSHFCLLSLLFQLLFLFFYLFIFPLILIIQFFKTWSWLLINNWVIGRLILL